MPPSSGLNGPDQGGMAILGCLERLNDKSTQRAAAEDLAGLVRVSRKGRSGPRCRAKCVADMTNRSSTGPGRLQHDCTGQQHLRHGRVGAQAVCAQGVCCVGSEHSRAVCRQAAALTFSRERAAYPNSLHARSQESTRLLGLLAGPGCPVHALALQPPVLGKLLAHVKKHMQVGAWLAPHAWVARDTSSNSMSACLIPKLACCRSSCITSPNQSQATRPP
jgi:hypothetical protein